MSQKKYPYQNLSLETMEGEVWEDVPGLDGYYRISNFGRIQRQPFETQCKDGKIRHMPLKMIKPELTLIKNNSVNDYVFFLKARMTQSGKAYNVSIARLVYYCFVKKFNLSDKRLVVLTKDANGKCIYPDNLILVGINRKQKRIFERNRLKRTFYHTYTEYVQEGVEKSVNPYCKQITQYSLDGKKIKTYPSIKAAALTLKISAASINSVLKERQISSGGFVWRYGKARSADVKGLWERKKIQIQKQRGQKVTQYDLKGRRIACYPAIAEAARISEAGSGEIGNVINGKQRTAGGFIWKKGSGKPIINVSGFLYGAAWRGQKRQKKINQYTPDGKYLQTFPSVKAAAQTLDINASAISLALSGKAGLIKGFKWKLAD